MSVFSSKSARRFFAKDVLQSNLPYDAEEIEDALYMKLMAGRAQGGSIDFDTSPPTLIPAAPGLMDRRKIAISRINRQRDQLLFGGIRFEGNVYQSDTLSRQRLIDASKNITAAAAVPTDYVWRTTDNRNVSMSGPKVVEFSIVAYNQQTAVLVLSRALKDEIKNSPAPESIVWPMVDEVAFVADDEVLLGSAMVDVPAAAMKASKAATNADLQALSLVALRASDLPKGVQIIDVAVPANGEVKVALTGYSVPPKIWPVMRLDGETAYFPKIIGTPTRAEVVVQAFMSRAVLLLSAGPFTRATTAQTVRIAVAP